MVKRWSSAQLGSVVNLTNIWRKYVYNEFNINENDALSCPNMNSKISSGTVFVPFKS